MQIDIFNDKYESLGVADKKLAHMVGLWHRVFTCLLYDPKKNIAFLQLKTPGRYDFERPDYVDISVGGHYRAGELIEEGARECQEELGLNVSYSDLISIGIRQTACHVSHSYVANEFQHIFLLPRQVALEDLSPADLEIAGFVELPIEIGIRLLKGEIDTIKTRRRVRAGDFWVVESCVLSIDSFPPAYLAIDKLIERLLIAAVRQIRGDDVRQIYW